MRIHPLSQYTPDVIVNHTKKSAITDKFIRSVALFLTQRFNLNLSSLVKVMLFHELLILSTILARRAVGALLFDIEILLEH